MKEDNTIDRIVMTRHARHIVVLVNALLGLVFIDYASHLIYRLYQFVSKQPTHGARGGRYVRRDSKKEQGRTP